MTPANSDLEREHFRALIEISKSVNASLDLDRVLATVIEVTNDAMGVEASSLLLLDPESHQLCFAAAVGEQANLLESIRLRKGEGIAGWVAEHEEPAVVHDVHADPRWTPTVDQATGFQTKSIVAVPLKTPERIIGVLEIMNKRNGKKFNEADVRLCEAIASQAAIAVENARLHREKLQAERLAAVGQTVAGLAHCVKNVLNAVTTGSYVLDQGIAAKDLDQVDKGWGVVKRNNEFLSELVLDMLTYSKEREPNYAWTDANEFCTLVRDLMDEKATLENATIELDLDKSLPEVCLDEVAIRRCLLNMVTNAIEACEGRKGRIVIRTEYHKATDTFRIGVADNGCGISEENQRRLFQVFFSTKGARGTGLGLPVIEKIVREHGGRIEVESEEGKGTTFTLELPVRPPRGNKPVLAP